MAIVIVAMAIVIAMAIEAIVIIVFSSMRLEHFLGSFHFIVGIIPCYLVGRCFADLSWDSSNLDNNHTSSTKDYNINISIIRSSFYSCIGDDSYTHVDIIHAHQGIKSH
jgi:hypothetical protein